jgi:phosphatidylethanolamine-binding protein (PEBP) family uncharacterized protein
MPPGYKTLKREYLLLKRSFKNHRGRKSLNKKIKSLSPSIKMRIRPSKRKPAATADTAATAATPPNPPIAIGGSPLVITYPNTIITRGQNLQQSLVKSPPSISIPNSINTTYLITMMDPDAPSGIFTHMVALYNKGNINYHVPYYPPTPPSGVHRYQFRLYDVSKLLKTTRIPSFSKDRVSYTPIINKYLKNTPQLGDAVEFKVLSKNI